MLDKFGFFFFQVKQVHGACASTTRSCFLRYKRTIIKKMYAIPRRKQYGGRKVRDADGDYLSFWDAK